MTYKKLTLLAFVGILTSASCFAQGGGSVNGPDLKGNMIPVFSDGEIPAEKVNTALTVCYKRIGSQVLEFILGRKVELGKNYYPNSQDVADVALPSRRMPPFSGSSVDINYYTDDIRSPEIIIRPGDTIRAKPSSNRHYKYDFSFHHEWTNAGPSSEAWTSTTSIFSLTYGFSNDDQSENQLVRLHTNHFPIMSYQLKDKSIYGELGDFVEKHFFVSNIRFVFKPGSTSTVFTMFTRRSDKTEVATPITVDAMDLINCIKSQLAN